MDKTLKRLVEKEEVRQKKEIDLIASENFVSADVMKLLGSVLTNKYSEGYPGRRYYPGNKYYDEIERLAQKYALKLFKLDPKKWAVNVQPYSGSPANLAVYTALLKPGEKIMGLRLMSGGHLTHGHSVSATAKFFKSVQYVTDKNGYIDFKEVEKLARKEKPQIVVSGTTAYPRELDFAKFGRIAKMVGAYHLADISHIAGLVAAGLHKSPFPYCDAVMTTTHKTLRGPRGAMIFSRIDRKIRDGKMTVSEAIDKAVFPGLQGGPHNNVTAAKAQAFYEALQPAFKKYQLQVVKNARVLAEELMKRGFELVTGGTDNHLMLVDLHNFGLDGLTAERALEKRGIIANRNTVPNDTSSFKPHGLRIGMPAMTTRGMKEKDMKVLAERIYRILKNAKN